MVAADSRDSALEELFRTPPATFTKTRDALAKRLKDEGEDAAAAELKKLRRPSVVAFVLNQLSRAHADDVAELVDVGRELARAQRKAIRGEATTGLREAIARQREVVASLTSKTTALMKKLGVSTSSHLDEVAGALQAALIDPAVGERLEEGRLEEIPAPEAGFGAPAAFAVVAPPKEAAKAKEAKAEPPPRKEKPAPKTAETKKESKARVAAAKKALAAEKKRLAAEEKKAAAEEKKRADAAAKALAKKAALAKADDEATALARAAKQATALAEASLAEAKELEAKARAAMTTAKKVAAEAKQARDLAARAAKQVASLHA